jgi:hypothetical protein
MMKDQVTYDFKLDRLTPQTLSMARLTQYLEKLVLLCGSKESVHFDMVRKGSAVQQFSVDRHAADDVQSRISLLNDYNEPQDIRKIKRDLNRMLRDDDCVGVLKVRNGATIYTFPGRKIPKVEDVVVQEFGELDGELIRVGGKDDSVPVWIKGADNVVSRCWATKATARDLAPYIFGTAVRVSGEGKWRKGEDGTWALEEFAIKSFVPLPADDLQDLVSRLRQVEGSEWNTMDNPQRELRKLRSEEW